LLSHLDDRRVAVAFILVACALFGTVGTARVLGPDASAWSVGASRILVGAVVLLVIAGRQSLVMLPVLRRPALWLAGIGQAAFQITFLSAVVRAGVAVGTLIAIGSAPIIAGLLTRTRSRVWAAATAIALSGLTLLVLDDSAGRVDLLGVVLALSAGASYSCYLVASRRLVDSDRLPPVAVAAVTFAIAAVLLLPALFFSDLGWLGTWGGVALVGYLAIFPTVVSYLLFTAGLTQLTPSTVATLGLAEPLVAFLLGVAWLGEDATVLRCIGALLVLAALLLLGRVTTRPVPELADLPA
jgi:DME family drug/metabolite transporter